jgi:F0F1-type ATP synthase assembly protein I|tara:strand:- start:421 stop:579 length:159 start_codon:yes stop_codon:yes gene_type:complete
MGALIFLGAYGGKWLDARYEFNKAWFTMLGTLIGMGLGLYLFLKGIQSDDDK